MASNAMACSIRRIGYDDDGGNGLHFECSNLRVCSNWQTEIMLYTGQLLLFKSGSKKKANSTATQRRPKTIGATQRPISPKKAQDAIACSKMFSALKKADLEFNSTSTTSITTTSTAGTTSTNTNTTSAGVKTSAAKSPRKSSSLFNFTCNSQSASKMPSNFPIDRANVAGETSPTKSPFAASTSQQKVSPAVAQLQPSSGEHNDASSSFNGSNKGHSTRVSFSKAQDKTETAEDVGATISFSSSPEGPFKASANSGKIATATRKKKVTLRIENGGHVDARCASEQIREGRQEGSSNSLAKELLNAQLHCFQIQHLLYRVLVAKLRNKESKTELQAARRMSKDVESDDVHSLLLPLETLLRCSDIQLGLHHSLNVALDSKANRLQDDWDGSGCKENIGRMIYDKDELLIESRSLMNHTKFAQSVVCYHLINPYSSNPRYASGEDRIFDWDSLFGNPVAGSYLPNGEGKLVSSEGNLIYEGQWKKGKRWGHGKAFIFSGTELSASNKQYGIYEGQWWNNMRHGHGRLVFASCAVYEGEWQYDLMSGVGAMHSPDGSVLEGLWDEDEPSGCCMFTWPDGSVGYREYQNGQVIRVLESPKETRKISPLNEVMREYSILRLKYQMMEEDKTRLVQAESTMKEQQRQAENSTKAKVKELRGEFTKLLQKEKKKVLEKHQENLKDMNERHDKKIKDLDDKIRQIEKELESKKSDLLCQICFERSRDCILMPCSHLLYCQVCISKIHECGGTARCPACRGSISSQINCNLNQ